MTNENFETYNIAKTWKRITARIIDIIIVSIIPLLITGIWYSIDKIQIQTWWVILILIIINFLLLIFYFVIFPWKFNGQTVGKKILLIKLVNQEKNSLTLKSILFRESFLVFIPIILTMSAIFITNTFFGVNIAHIDENTTSGFWINIFIRTMFSFVFAWYLGIMIVTKVDKKHQLFYDRKHNLFIVNKKAINKKNSKQKNNFQNLIHIHLGSNQPGNIKDDELKNIQNL